MSEIGNYSHESLGPTPLVRDAIIEATFDANRALDREVERLLLVNPNDPQSGNMRVHVEEPLRTATLTDPLHREHGFDIMVTNSHKLLIPKKQIVGTESQLRAHTAVSVGYAYAGNELLLVQDRYMASLAHTHPVELPPSPQDLGELFYDSENVAAETAVWVITPTGTWMIFRGQNTPEWTKEESQAKIEAWNSMIGRRVDQHLQHNMSRNQVLNLNYRAQTAFLRQMANTYDLQIFVGAKESTALTRYHT